MLKFIIIIPVLIAIIFALVKETFCEGCYSSIVISSLLFKLWRRRHYKETEYDEIGYWSGLDDFELGIDLHCFNDLEISDDELDLFPGDYYDGRPV